MAESWQSSPVLNYDRAESWLGRWLARLPRPSWVSLILLLLAVASARWFVLDHDPWVVQYTFPFGNPSLSGQFSADGSRLATVSCTAPNELITPFRIWDLHSGKLIREFGEFAVYDQTMLSPDGSRLIAKESRTFKDGTMQYSDRVRLWDVNNGILVADLCSASGFFDMRFSPDGSRVAFCDDIHAMLYEGATGKLLSTLANSDYPNGIWFSPDCKKVMIGLLATGICRIYSNVDGQLLGEAKLSGGERFGPITAGFSSEGEVTACAQDGCLRLFTAADGSPRGPAIPIVGIPAGLVFSRDDAQVIVSSGDRDGMWLTSVDSKSGSVIRKSSVTVMGTLSWTAKGQLVISDYNYPTGGDFGVFDSNTLKPVTSLSALPKGYGQFSSDSSHLIYVEDLCAGLDLYRTDTWKKTFTIKDREDGMCDGAFMSDGRLLTATTSGPIRVWRQQRSEGRGGILELPQFWLTVLSSVLLLCSAWRDLRRFFQPAKT